MTSPANSKAKEKSGDKKKGRQEKQRSKPSSKAGRKRSRRSNSRPMSPAKVAEHGAGQLLHKSSEKMTAKSTLKSDSAPLGKKSSLDRKTNQRVVGAKSQEKKTTTPEAPLAKSSGLVGRMVGGDGQGAPKISVQELDSETRQKIDKNRQAIETIIHLLRGINPEKINSEIKADLIHVFNLIRSIKRHHHEQTRKAPGNRKDSQPEQPDNQETGHIDQALTGGPIESPKTKSIEVHEKEVKTAKQPETTKSPSDKVPPETGKTSPQEADKDFS